MAGGERAAAFEFVEPEGFRVDHPVWDVPWLDELRELPPEATWPRFMTVPHPRAVGSYGAAAVEWQRDVAGIELRWWQRLANVRMLEHDVDGMLVWLEVLLTTSRQSGKSTGLRGGATWRIHQADLFGEIQTLIHTGKDLPVCKEVQRLARAWAKAREYVVREQNGNEEITEPESGSRWIVRGKGSVYGYSASAALVDEAWGVLPEVVEDGIEPTMMERMSPQLVLASTAHRRATPLFCDRRVLALDQLAEPADTLLLEWSAPRSAVATPDDRGAWRQASPHWSANRERVVRKALDRARSGQSLDPDEVDPMESFAAQYLNVWPISSMVGAQVLLPTGAWDAAAGDVMADGPVVVAIEDNAGHGAAIAAASMLDDGRLVVGGSCCRSRGEAMRRAGLLFDAHDVTAVVIGPNLDDDDVDAPVETDLATGSDTRAGLSLLRELVAAGRVVNDGSADLASQIQAARITTGLTGVRLHPGPRSDLLRAAVWALRVAAREPATPEIISIA